MRRLCLAFFLLLEMSMSAEVALFGMGCFWCGETEFRSHQTGRLLPGIESVRVGYAGGTIPNPTYENHPGYVEAVQITFDPEVISYSDLLKIFWSNIDPYDAYGQFCDKGPSYVSVIYYLNEEQQQLAERSKSSLNGNVVTEILPYTTYYDAEEYHQNYAQKNPIRYKYYRWSCGRDKRLQQLNI